MCVTVWRSLWFRYGLFLLCASVVAYGIFRPTPPPVFFQQSDKVEHIVAFLSLSLTARWAFVRVRWFYFWPMLLGMAPLVEYLQGEWQPARVYSIEDSYANLLGVVIAFLLILVANTSARYRNST